MEGTAVGGRRAAPFTGAPPGAESPLERLLREDPNSFEFAQAVRVLERLRPDRDAVGGFGDPRAEVVRFGAHPSISFPASEIQTLELDDVDAPARMTVNFIGLTGPLGVMPLNYTLLVAERARARDGAMRDFLDIFNHRITSLFYRAWEKYRFTVAHERGRDDPLLGHLRDLVGVGTGGLQHRLAVPDETLVYYSGLLAMKARPAAALEQLVQDYFDVPATVEQFVGGWYPLDEGTQCELGDESTPSSQLGLGAVAGDEIWDQQARVRVRIGPLTRRQYDDFLPDGAAHAPLRALLRFFGEDQLDFEVQLVLARDETPPCVLGDEGQGATPLGWCTWLRTAPMDRDPDETILTL
ncbi:MAG TPA: type VI secretion system baseplate subunit TssG [Gemmatimonadaceae bacterium]|nr:type VI secretion system baseplate subunit TssG [Gemmatimonadaceae bacterium]